MFGITGWEFIALGLIAVVVLGPERLPEYAAKLAQFIRKARGMAEEAKGQLKDQLGPEYQDINWRQYDPRQYDPRRIVKQALLEPLELDTMAGDLTDMLNGTDGAAAGSADLAGVATMGAGSGVWNPDLPTPYDGDAT